jgi:hypothetical protein
MGGHLRRVTGPSGLDQDIVGKHHASSDKDVIRDTSPSRRTDHPGTP